VAAPAARRHGGVGRRRRGGAARRLRRRGGAQIRRGLRLYFFAKNFQQIFFEFLLIFFRMNIFVNDAKKILEIFCALQFFFLKFFSALIFLLEMFFWSPKFFLYFFKFF